MIDLSTGVFSCFGSHLSVFAMHRGAQNANRGKKVEKNTGRVLYDAGLTPGLYIRNFIHRRNYEMNLFRLENLIFIVKTMKVNLLTMMLLLQKQVVRKYYHQTIQELKGGIL